MSVGRSLGALAVVTGLAACGGSAQLAGRSSSSGAPAARVAPSPGAIILPASSDGPTTCTVYEHGFNTQVVFDSETLNVSPECQAWTSRDSGSGYLWGYQPPDNPVDVAAVRVCTLRDPSGRVSASVIEDNAFAPITRAQKQRSATACTSMLASGWRRYS